MSETTWVWMVDIRHTMGALPLAALVILLAGSCDSINSGGEDEVPTARFMVSPFEGDYPVTNVFDHSTSLLTYDDTNRQTAYWGEEVGGLAGHRGYDWIMPEGIPLLAVADGVVHRSGEAADEYCPPLGRTVTNLRVIIRHERPDGKQFLIIYSHVSRTEVGQGEEVEAGQVIALSGNTGCSTAPHLHFEVWYRLPTSAPTATGALGTVGSRYADVDPYGWIPSDPDPWREAPDGYRSWTLWIAEDQPRLKRGWRRFPSSNPNTQAPVVLVDWVMLDVSARDNLNGELVELSLNTRKVSGAIFDLTGFFIENRKGDRFIFPDGYTIRSGQNVRVFSGAGMDSQGALFWNRTDEAWSNMGDCVSLRDSEGRLLDRFALMADCD